MRNRKPLTAEQRATRSLKNKLKRANMTLEDRRRDCVRVAKWRKKRTPEQLEKARICELKRKTPEYIEIKRLKDRKRHGNAYIPKPRVLLTKAEKQKRKRERAKRRYSTEAQREKSRKYQRDRYWKDPEASRLRNRIKRLENLPEYRRKDRNAKLLESLNVKRAEIFLKELYKEIGAEDPPRGSAALRELKAITQIGEAT